MRIGEPFAHCKLAMVICRFLYRCAAGARLGTERTASLDLITALFKQGSTKLTEQKPAERTDGGCFVKLLLQKQS
jgi:hypothetical protein